MSSPDKISQSPHGSDSTDDNGTSSRVSTPTTEPNLKPKTHRVRFPSNNDTLSTVHYPSQDQAAKSVDNIIQHTIPFPSPSLDNPHSFKLPPLPKFGKKRPTSPLPGTEHHDPTYELPASSSSDPSFSGVRSKAHDDNYFTYKPPTYIPSKHRDSEVLQRTTLANTLYNRTSSAQLAEELNDPQSDNDDDNSKDNYSENNSGDSIDSGAELLTVPEAAVTTSANPLSHILDIGTYTSGGLAPGAVNYEEKNKEHAHSAPNSIPSSPNFHGENVHGDIQLMNLDRRLHDLKSQTDSMQATGEAETLIRSHTLRSTHGHPSALHKFGPSNFTAAEGYTVRNSDYIHSAAAGRVDPDGSHTPLADGSQTPHHEDYIAPPDHVKLGILGSLLKLYGENDASKSTYSIGSNTTGGIRSEPTSLAGSPTDSGASTPALASSPAFPSSPAAGVQKPTSPKLRHLYSSEDGTSTRPKSPKWYKHKSHSSTSSLGDFVLSASQALVAPGLPPDNKYSKKQGAYKKKQKAARLAEQIRITVHIADVLQRQRFILRMCRALMMFGAPTHRLEEYMKMTSRVLEIDGQFLYIPGCMITSFGDPTTHTSEMHLVRCVQGLNLSKLQHVHQIYKEVVHDIIGVEDASTKLDDLLKSKNLYPRWLCILFFGLAGASFALLSFGGRWRDFPISLVLGCIVGFLQIWVAPRSDLYSNVFEVTSSILVSFLGRAFGSIGNKEVFCFAAIAQGSLALILPGYIILCGSLELQSKNIVAGSVRMFYAVIYSCKW